MYTLDNLYRDTMLLTNSFVIKLLDIGIAMERGISLKYDRPVPYLKTEWKYFQNLAGMKHFDNQDVYITLKENNEKVLLTKELLNIYTLTKEELLKCGSYYQELIEQYPDEIMYINGCMYPVDINDAINAPDGTILAYNKNFIEPQEIDLIKNIEAYIINYFKRYYITEYAITDELYLPGLLSVLYSMLPNQVMKLRVANIGTHRVHSFFMKEFFNSHLNMWDDISVLNDETKFWLYKNLRYLMKNVGKNKTLEIIAKRIFEENGIGLGTYELNVKDPVPNGNMDDITKLPFDIRDVEIKVRKLNNVFMLSSGTKDLKDVILDELNITEDDKSPEYKNYTVNTIYEKVRSNLLYTEETKILDIITPTLFKVSDIDVSATLLYNLVDTIDRYQKQILYVDPNTNAGKKITSKEAIFILLKLFLYLIGNKDVKLTNLHYTVLKTKDEITIDDLTYNLHDKDRIEPIAGYLWSSLPDKPGTIIKPSEYKDYMDKVFRYHVNQWLLMSNAENDMIQANMKIIQERVTKDLVLEITDEPKTIDEILDELGINFEITNTYDIISAIKTLLKTFTEVNIDRYEEIEEINKKYTRILRKLTSYTLQILDNQENETITNLYYNHNTILNNKGLITVTDADFIPYEKDMVKIVCKGNDFTEFMFAFKNNFNTRLDDVTDINSGICYCGFDRPLSGEVTRPVMSVEILDEYIADDNMVTELFIGDNVDYITDVYVTLNTIDPELADVSIINSGIAYDKFPHELAGIVSKPNMSAEVIDEYLDEPPMTIAGFIGGEDSIDSTYQTLDQPNVKDLEQENEIVVRTGELVNNEVVAIKTKPNTTVIVEE